MGEEKRQQKESLKAKKEKPSPENIKSAPTEENQEVTDAEDLTAEAPEEVPESDLPAEGETKPTAVSVIKRGVPKNTKPAPAVVAIKMADLLGEGTADEETDEVMQPEPHSPPTSDTNVEKEMQIKEQKELERQKLQEAKPLEKERKLKEKQAKELEAKQKKQQEQLDKQQKQEQLRLEKERKAQEKKLKDEQ